VMVRNMGFHTSRPRKETKKGRFRRRGGGNNRQNPREGSASTSCKFTIRSCRRLWAHLGQIFDHHECIKGATGSGFEVKPGKTAEKIEWGCGRGRERGISTFDLCSLNNKNGKKRSSLHKENKH